MAKPRAKQGKTQPPPTSVVKVGNLTEQLNEATVALNGAGLRPRLFREMCRAIGAKHMDVIQSTLDGTARQEVPMVVSDGKYGSHVEMVERGPTIMEKLVAWKAVADAGLKGVQVESDGGQSEGVKRAVIRFPVPVEVVEVKQA